MFQIEARFIPRNKQFTRYIAVISTGIHPVPEELFVEGEQGKRIPFNGCRSHEFAARRSFRPQAELSHTRSDNLWDGVAIDTKDRKAWE